MELLAVQAVPLRGLAISLLAMAVAAGAATFSLQLLNDMTDAVERADRIIAASSTILAGSRP